MIPGEGAANKTDNAIDREDNRHDGWEPARRDDDWRGLLSAQADDGRGVTTLTHSGGSAAYLNDALDAVNQELRAPLGVIKGFTTALLAYGHRFPAQECVAMLAEIDGAADTLTALLDDLMELRRLSFGGVARVDDMVDIGEVAVMVAREAAPRHLTQSIEAVVHMAAAGATLVRGDVQALSRLLHILVATALAHSGADARVGITVAQQPGRVELRIEGEGMAIPPDELARFFARPRPSENVPWRRAGALGLRLAIVAGLVAAHAGAIRVENAGTGVAVVVTLPIG